MKQLKNGNWRYRNATITPVPTLKYPDMVLVVKAPKRMKELIGKKYLNLKFTKLAIENSAAEALIRNGAKSVEAQLESICVLEK